MRRSVTIAVLLLFAFVGLALWLRMAPSKTKNTELQGYGLPVLRLNAGSGAIETLHGRGDHSMQVPVTMELIMPDGTTKLSTDCRWQGHGSWSWRGAEKKSYDLNFFQPTCLLDDNTSVKTWTLVPNATDTTHLRNGLYTAMARRLGVRHTTPVDFVVLYVNEECRGLYALATKWIAMADTAYVNVIEQTDTFSGFDYLTRHGVWIVNKSGAMGQGMRAVEHFEDVFYADTTTWDGLQSVMDRESFCRKMFLELITGNSDISRSQYYGIGRDGRLEAVGAWDGDFGFGRNKIPKFLPCVMHRRSKWFNRMWEFPEFRTMVDERLRTEGESLLAFAEDYVTSTEESIAQAKHQDHLIWAEQSPDEVLPIIPFFKERLSFLRKFIADSTQFVRVSIIDEKYPSINRDIVCYQNPGDSTVSMWNDCVNDTTKVAGYRSADGQMLGECLVPDTDITFYATHKPAEWAEEGYFTYDDNWYSLLTHKLLALAVVLGIILMIYVAKRI